MPKLSIITVCYNAAHTIQKTVESVLAQSFTDYEYIIIDGASTDGTLQVIEPYMHRITKCISEKDKGIFDAMNKGIRIACGEYCYFLNADDFLYDAGVLARVFEGRTGWPDFLFGHIAVVYPEGLCGVFYYAPPVVNKYVLSVYGAPHQGTFIKRELFLEYGLYDGDAWMLGDYEFFLRVFAQKRTSFFCMNYTIAYYSMDGRSTKYCHTKSGHLERAAILKKHLPFPIVYFFILLSAFKNFVDNHSESVFVAFLGLLLNGCKHVLGLLLKVSAPLAKNLGK